MTTPNMQHNTNGRAFQGWIAELADGTQVYEAQVEPGRGELTTWQTLVQRVVSGQATIQRLALVRAGTTVFAMPGAPAYFQAREKLSSVNTKLTLQYQGIGTVDTGLGLVFITWIDVKGIVVQDVRPLRDVYLHTTARTKQDIIGG